MVPAAGQAAEMLGGGACGGGAAGGAPAAFSARPLHLSAQQVQGDMLALTHQQSRPSVRGRKRTDLALTLRQSK